MILAMSLDQLTELYAAVLRQLLPVGGYDNAPGTNIAKDIYGHAKALAQADLDGKRLLDVIDSIPSELLDEYEHEFGLPLPCSVAATQTTAERLAALEWVRQSRNVFNRDYLNALFAAFAMSLQLQTYKPMQCTSSCTSAVNTEQLRYKVKLNVNNPNAVNIDCVIENFLPAFLRYDINEV